MPSESESEGRATVVIKNNGQNGNIQTTMHDANPMNTVLHSASASKQYSKQFVDNEAVIAMM